VKAAKTLTVERVDKNLKTRTKNISVIKDTKRPSKIKYISDM